MSWRRTHRLIQAQNALRFARLRNRKVKGVAGPKLQVHISCELGRTAKLRSLLDGDRAMIPSKAEEARTRLLRHRTRRAPRFS